MLPQQRKNAVLRLRKLACSQSFLQAPRPSSASAVSSTPAHAATRACLRASAVCLLLSPRQLLLDLLPRLQRPSFRLSVQVGAAPSLSCGSMFRMSRSGAVVAWLGDILGGHRSHGATDLIQLVEEDH